jgi:hypothetical protein
MQRKNDSGVWGSPHGFLYTLLISIISYYFTHTIDTNYITDISDNIKPTNAAGVIGAGLAYFL